MHLPYNFKGSDESGYCNFLCHCHEDWCYQLRVRNKYWGQQVKNEKAGTEVCVIQKALYEVNLKSEDACNGCHECYNRKPYVKKSKHMRQVFICPAQAISKTPKGISIDTEKCLRCMLCVRNCFRVRQSNDIALTVTPIQGQDNTIPDTHRDMEVERAKSAIELNWTHFRYDIEGRWLRRNNR